MLTEPFIEAGLSHILRPLENPKKQSDGGGRLETSRFLFRLAFLSWPWRWYDVSLCFCKIPEFSGSYVDRVYSSGPAQGHRGILPAFHVAADLPDGAVHVLDDVGAGQRAA